METRMTERIAAVVIGGGQAGLAVSHGLAGRGVPHVVLDAGARVGDVWRHRWDSLRLFSPAKYNGLPGLPFPAPANYFPTKDEMGDYLESYAAHFRLPVRTGMRVERLRRDGARYSVETRTHRFEADHVVVAMSSYQKPRIPDFAGLLAPAIRQLSVDEYRNPGQLQPGGVLLVGAGNSGADIALDVVSGHETWLAGRHPGHVPFRPGSGVARLVLPVLFRVVFHRLLTVDTSIGRKARPNVMKKGTALIRVKPKDLAAAGVERVGRVTGVKDGRPLLDDGRTLDVTNVIWCAGFDHGFSWIDLPILGADHEPAHDKGIVTNEPGLYFVGLHFLYAFSSSMIHGVGRDADRIAETIRARMASRAVEANSAVPNPALSAAG